VIDDGKDLSHFSMLDLFRMEVESQAGILNNSLLALERNAEPAEALEALMRAAHSIKGAARLVDLDTVVNLAHVMEECFVTAQATAITFTADQIDILLQGIDWLLRLAQVPEADLNHWLSERDADVDQLMSAIANLLKQKPAVRSSEMEGEEIRREAEQLNPPIKPDLNNASSPNPPNPLRHQSSIPTPPSIPTAAQNAPYSARDRVVRVGAESLNRLMGLAGESLVEANWLQPFADSLFKLRNQQAELSNLLTKLQESLAGQPLNQRSQADLAAARQQANECRQMLADRLNELELFTRRSTNLSDRLYREVIASHMRPLADGVQGFPRMVRDLARQLGKQVNFEILGNATKVDRDILEKLEAPLIHLLRNAIDHGIESPSDRLDAGKSAEGVVRLDAVHRAGMLSITISDDGRGVDLEQLRQRIVSKQLASADMADQLTEAELLEFLFLPGFSTDTSVTEISGRGVGLDVVLSMVQQVGGSVRAVSEPGKGMHFHLQLPLTLSVIRTLLVEISGEPYAFPLTRIDQIIMLDRNAIALTENRQYFTLDGHNIGLVAAHQVLELDDSTPDSDQCTTIVISDRLSRYGLVVDRCLGERDLVVRPLDRRLGKVKNISAAALLEDGSPVLLVDVEDLVRSIDHLLVSGQLSRINRTTKTSALASQKRILVVDDSITVREMERKLLQNRGYTVEVAVNGMEGWNAARTGQFDLVITDIDMPRMNGIELVNQLKLHPNLKSLPVIVVSYKDREEDRLQGLEAGANYYLTKSSFHDDTLINAVGDLIGKANGYP
jgi:two-component system sensor histidine kinase and response regulator WspE